MEQTSINVFILKHVATFVIGIVIGAYLKRFLRVTRKYLYILGDKISSKNRFKGIWKATFIYQGQPYPENIKLYVVFDRYILGIIEDVQSKFHKATRLYGSIEENRINGIWYHPNEEDNHTGTFDLVLEQNGRQIIGTWTGHNVKTNPQMGDWQWKK
jgi:hypothetical protein